MSKPRPASSRAKRKYGDPSSSRHAGLPQDDNKGAPRTQSEIPRFARNDNGGMRRAQDDNKGRPKARHKYVYRAASTVDRVEEDHPGMRALIETLLRRRVRLPEIARQVYEQCGVRLSVHSLSRYYMVRVKPQESAEAEAYRQAHAQARALIEEMKADPSLDAAQIAELMLAHQIVQSRSKLAEADIMDLYREQRERRKLELQHRALLLKEKQTRAVLEKLKGPRKPRPSHEEMVNEIRGIYGLSEAPPAAEAPGPENSQ